MLSLQTAFSQDTWRVHSIKYFLIINLVQCYVNWQLQNSIIGLTKDNVLLWNGQEVCRNVGSYSVDDEFLLLLLLPTGSATCKLYTVEVQKLVETRLSCLLVNGRTVEQGAVIIGHENFGTRVWLEMPRGFFLVFTLGSASANSSSFPLL